jgi:Raf kinase inhibitor-like YbhB/YbcL family protein
MFSLTSPAFPHGGAIPAKYTGDGPDESPPLQWMGVPEGTKALALIVDDPDAPDPAAPKRTWVHWVVSNLPATVTSLKEGASRRSMPAGAREGRNDSGDVGYSGPYPPKGRHRYFFKLYALDSLLGSSAGETKGDLLRAMGSHVLDMTELMGTYERDG